MIMMMTDPDRVALSAFLPAFLFRFIHPFMPTSTPTFHRNAPPAICHTSYYPVRSSSSLSHHSKFVCFLPTSRQHLAYMPDPPLLLTPSLAQHLSAGLLPSLLFASKQPTSTQKNLQSRVTTRPPPPHSLQASTRTRTYVRLSMYLLPVAVFISHQKEGFVREVRLRSTKKRRRSEQYFIVAPIQETIIKS